MSAEISTSRQPSQSMERLVLKKILQMICSMQKDKNFLKNITLFDGKTQENESVLVFELIRDFWETIPMTG
jgi:hypothetical protein